MYTGNSLYVNALVMEDTRTACLCSFTVRAKNANVCASRILMILYLLYFRDGDNKPKRRKQQRKKTECPVVLVLLLYCFFQCN